MGALVSNFFACVLMAVLCLVAMLVASVSEVVRSMQDSLDPNTFPPTSSCSKNLEAVHTLRIHEYCPKLLLHRGSYVVLHGLPSSEATDSPVVATVKRQEEVVEFCVESLASCSTGQTRVVRGAVSGFFAIAAGTYYTAPGKVLHANCLEISSKGFTFVGFPNHFDENAEIVVVAALASHRQDGFLKVRMEDVSHTGFRVALETQHEVGAELQSEEVCWVATVPGPGTLLGSRIIAGVTPISSNSAEINFKPAFSAPPVFVAAMMTSEERDSAQLRELFLTKLSVSLLVEENECDDQELDHAEEMVGWIALEFVPQECMGKSQYRICSLKGC
eukprot:c32240_g1_i1.p1 GENE.c32240_g1_i1~~c32240_g1_i1.p1  ORF type:complete len:332 (+),score=63.99 c32240_g1_i1:1-996(+)